MLSLALEGVGAFRSEPRSDRALPTRRRRSGAASAGNAATLARTARRDVVGVIAPGSISVLFNFTKASPSGSLTSQWNTGEPAASVIRATEAFPLARVLTPSGKIGPNSIVPPIGALAHGKEKRSSATTTSSTVKNSIRPDGPAASISVATFSKITSRVSSESAIISFLQLNDFLNSFQPNFEALHLFAQCEDDPGGYGPQFIILLTDDPSRDSFFDPYISTDLAHYVL